MLFPLTSNQEDILLNDHQCGGHSSLNTQSRGCYSCWPPIWRTFFLQTTKHIFHCPLYTDISLSIGTLYLAPYTILGSSISGYESEGHSLHWSQIWRTFFPLTIIVEDVIHTDHQSGGHSSYWSHIWGIFFWLTIKVQYKMLLPQTTNLEDVLMYGHLILQGGLHYQAADVETIIFLDTK